MVSHFYPAYFVKKFRYHSCHRSWPNKAFIALFTLIMSEVPTWENKARNAKIWWFVSPAPMRLSSWQNLLVKLAFSACMHANKYVRSLCETSDIPMEFRYVSHIYLTYLMVLRSPLQLSTMPHLSKLPYPVFALKEIAGLSENVSANCNHAQHRSRIVQCLHLDQVF